MTSGARKVVDDPEPAQETKRWLELTELVAKAGAVVVGVLYGLGLLVSNGHALQLGVPEPGALDARYVIVGGLFVVHSSLPLILLAIVPAFLTWGASSTRTWAARAAMALTVLVLLACLGLFLGDIVGYLAVGGRSWVPGPRYEFEPRVSVRQLLEAYGAPSVAIGEIGAAATAMFVWWMSRPPLRDNRWFALPSAFLGMMCAPALLFGYSANVFPNLRYSLGGGSPQVQVLLVPVDQKETVAALGLDLAVMNPGTIAVGPVAIWHQSSAFTYVTQVQSGKPSQVRVAAIPTEKIAGFRVLPMFVEVRNGLLMAGGTR
jgi:hypothetical protein